MLDCGDAIAFDFQNIGSCDRGEIVISAGFMRA